MNLNCLGCQLSNKLIPIKLLNDDIFFSVIMDHDPINPGHLLIIPKVHIENFANLSQDLMVSLQKVIHHFQELLSKKLGYTDFTIQINEGKINDLNQHLHIHLIPRKVDDGVQLSTTNIEDINLDHVYLLLTQ